MFLLLRLYLQHLAKKNITALVYLLLVAEITLLIQVQELPKRMPKHGVPLLQNQISRQVLAPLAHLTKTENPSD